MIITHIRISVKAMKSFLLIKMRSLLQKIIETLPPPEDHILSKMVNDRVILHGDIGKMPSVEKKSIGRKWA